VIDEILSTTAGGRARIALREEGRLVDLVIAGDGAPDTVASIVLGRVNAVLPGMEAAFVDIGAERAGFLSLMPRSGENQGVPRSGENQGVPRSGENQEVPPRGDGEGDGAGAGPDRFAPIHEGAEVLVQVTKTAQAGKGAGLTRNISLAGRYLVLTPMQARTAISRRIEDPGERAALESAMAEIAAPGEGFILRTAARDAGAPALAEDAAQLRGLWASIMEKRDAASPPRILHGVARGLGGVLRDCAHDGLRRILVDDRRAEAEAQAFCDAHLPDLGTRIELWDEAAPMFEALGVEDELAVALETRVTLACGGSLIIEQTQALCAIDVNTGRNVGRTSHADTVRATNLEAAEEIPRQLRLRGLGGITVIDFIHMDDAADRDRVLAALMAGLTADPAFISAGGVSELGLVELARRRGDGPLEARLEQGDD
jgi:ribonuclease G